MAGPSFRRAELYQRLSNPVEAGKEYARFLELWKDADPELQPLVAQARERLTQLSAQRPRRALPKPG